MRTFPAARMKRILCRLLEPSLWPIICYLATNAWARLVGRRTAPNSALCENCREEEPIIRELPWEPRRSDEIPKIVFQTWKGRVEIPPKYRYWRSTFVKLNSDFQHLLWDDLDNRTLITNQFAWFLPVYDRFPLEIFRVDAVRAFFLLRYGGIYADMDTECLEPLAMIAKSGDVVLGKMGPDFASENALPNAVMASKPFQLFWALFIALMIEKANEYSVEAMIQRGPERCTGPIVLKETFEFYCSEPEDRVRARALPVTSQLPEALRMRLHAGKIQLLAPDLWYPMDWTNPLHQMLRNELQRQNIVLSPTEARKLFPNAILVTYWTHSW